MKTFIEWCKEKGLRVEGLMASDGVEYTGYGKPKSAMPNPLLQPQGPSANTITMDKNLIKKMKKSK